MRVGINAHFLQRPMTGSGQYTRNLYAALSEIGEGDEYILISPGTERSSGTGERRPSLQIRPSSLMPRQMAKIWFEQISAPGVARGEALDVLHYPYFAAPLAGGRRVVVTIHDVIPLLLSSYRGSLAVRAYSLLVSVAARRAAAIITDSESSKADIVRLLGIPPERITVIYLAVDRDFTIGEDPNDVVRVRRKYNLTDDFVLYMGGLDYRKNVVALVEAFAEASKQLEPNYRLAIAGEPLSVGPLFPDVKDAVKRLGMEEAVLFLGAVADGDRAYLYRAASAFVYPSLYEGFGLPPLEAMACGTPVICSNSSSLPEVVGNAAVLFPPDDRAELARVLMRVLSDKDLCVKLRRMGTERAQEFSWEKTAKETVAVYRSVRRVRNTG